MTISPVGRGGTPEDIAGLVSYLASKNSFMVTGTFYHFYSNKLILHICIPPPVKQAKQ